ncbi:LuxR C-terminal-related transcriptional regulator, partial [Thalassiella azotivora]
EDGWRLVVEAADALRRCGDDGTAVDLLRRELVGGPPGAVDEPAGGVPLTGRLLLLDRLQACLFARGDAPAAFAVLDEAAALARAAPGTPEAARVAAADGSRLMVLGRFADGARRSAEAVAAARAAGDDEVRAYALTTQGVCTAAAGDVRAGLGLLEDADAAAAGAGVAVQARVAVNRCYVLANVTDHASCVLVGREALARLAVRGLAGTLGAPLHVNVAASSLALARWPEVLAAAEAARGAGAPPTTSAFLSALVARVHALRGEPGPADEALRAAEESGPRGQPAFDAELVLARAVVHAAAGRPAETVTVAVSAVPRTTGVDGLRLCATGLAALADLPATRDRLRRPDDPAAARAVLLAAATRRAGDWSDHAPEAVLLRRWCEAEARRAHGGASRLDPDDWQALADGWAGTGHRHDEAYALVRTAQAHVEAGRPGAATAPLGRAHEVAAELGAEPLLRVVRTVARRGTLPLGAGSEPARRRPRDATAMLTGREREVLALVAEGCTNRQIARRLVISDKTAEAHVSHVLAKLGARNRVEAARAAHLLTPSPGADDGA